MVALPISRPVTVALTPSLGIAAAAAVATVCLFLPSATLEAIVLASGVPAILPAAEPPLGYTARAALAMTAGGAAGAIVWLAAFLAFGGEGLMTLPAMTTSDPTADGEPVPVLRRADAHPDAPARAPLLATRDLGAPFLDVRADAERHLPRDLDAPLAAYDPAAIPETPVAAVATVASLQPRRIAADLDPGERIDAFELPRPVPAPDAPTPIAAPRTDATIHALLDRLERGVATRPRPDAGDRPASLAETLEQLRGFAVR